MKTSIIVIVMVLSQSLMAKISESDFNTMIQEESVAQKETYRSLKENNFKATEISADASIGKTDVIVFGAIQEDISQVNTMKSASSVSIKKAQIKRPDMIEEKQFIRLGEELDEAR